MKIQETLWTTSQGKIRLLPERGRLLGMEVLGHQALWQPASVDAQWNLGGERLWLGPESDWFWLQTKKVDFSQYEVPASLNPDGWSVSSVTADQAEAELRLNLESTHSGRWLDLAIRREWRLLADCSPYGSDRSIGLSTTTSLKILGGSPGQSVDLWSILQIPPHGEVRMATRGVAAPRDYFEPCPPTEMTSAAEQFTLQMGGPAVFKIGIAPEQCTGAMSYVRAVPDGWLVLTRDFPVDVGHHYCDTPLNALGSQGDAVQFFNDGGQHGCFGELEHHSPALICGHGPQRYTETTVTSVAFLTTPEIATYQHRPLPKQACEV
jgi:hypothetical protein